MQTTLSIKTSQKALNWWGEDAKDLEIPEYHFIKNTAIDIISKYRDGIGTSMLINQIQEKHPNINANISNYYRVLCDLKKERLVKYHDLNYFPL